LIRKTSMEVNTTGMIIEMVLMMMLTRDKVDRMMFCQESRGKVWLTKMMTTKGINTSKSSKIACTHSSEFFAGKAVKQTLLKGVQKKPNKLKYMEITHLIKHQH
jgi:hypothetical protein